MLRDLPLLSTMKVLFFLFFFFPFFVLFGNRGAGAGSNGQEAELLRGG